jgi:flavin-dependent dehydrogenase
MLPEAVRGLPWATGIQMHYQGKIRISPDHFHAFFHRDVGVYAWANVKDGRILAGVAGIGKNKASQYYRNFLALLKGVYGLKIEEILQKEGMAGFMMAPLGRLALGKDNFLAAGDAAGFMHNGGEGISCALSTGDLAAEAILSAERTGSKAIDIYRRIVKGEVDLCLDQTNLLRMFRKLPLPLDLRSFCRNQSLRDIRLMVRDLKVFGAQDNGMKETGFGGIARKNMIHRLLRGRYPAMP